MQNTFDGAHSVPVQFREGEKNFQGDLFLPENAQGALPLVLVVHEWWGKTGHVQQRAARISRELGYAALAVDLFGDAKMASSAQEAQALATPLFKDPAIGVHRLQSFVPAASAAVKGPVSIDAGRVASIGYCFGGTQSLNLARVGALPGDARLLGVVSFHGSLSSSLQAKAPVRPRILVLHGGADQMVPPQEVAAFKEEMKNAGAELLFHAYPGALHGFTNPEATERGKKFGIPIAYDEAADRDSWQRMASFLKGLFGR